MEVKSTDLLDSFADYFDIKVAAIVESVVNDDGVYNG